MTDQIKTDNARLKGEQLPLAFSYKAASGRDDLLVSASLEGAISLVDEWPNWPSPVVVLVGPPGSGKSHLANIWKNIADAQDIHPQAGADVVRAAESRPVLFEDADRRGFDEAELFHVINSVHQHGTTLLMTSRQWSVTWPVTLLDLYSRLKAVMVVKISEPDEGLLEQVLVKLFADRQLYIDNKLIDYIVNRMERSFNTAQTVVDRIDRLALARGAKITRPLAAEVLNTMDSAAMDGD